MSKRGRDKRKKKSAGLTGVPAETNSHRQATVEIIDTITTSGENTSERSLHELYPQLDWNGTDAYPYHETVANPEFRKAVYEIAASIREKRAGEIRRQERRKAWLKRVGIGLGVLKAIEWVKSMLDWS